ncbi:histidine kinase [Nitrosopumilus sp. S4]
MGNDKKPDIVPSNLSASINFKIIGIIIAGVISLQIVVSFVDDPTLIVYAPAMLIPLSVAILSFLNSRSFSESLVYHKAFFALGIGFLGLFLGEFTYLIYEQFLGLDPYPSIADVFFYLLYPMTLVYLILNIRFFAVNISVIDKLILIIIPLIITFIYILFSYSWIEESSFDFFYGVAFIGAISTTLGFSIYGVRIFKKGMMETSWILLALGILLFTFGDSWYYYLELFEGYDITHPVLSLWYGGYLLIMYSLLLHRKIL